MTTSNRAQVDPLIPPTPTEEDWRILREEADLPVRIDPATGRRIMTETQWKIYSYLSARALRRDLRPGL